LPTYFNQIHKTRRTDAKSALLTAAGQMQRYFTERNTFQTATLGPVGVYPSTSENGYYALTLTGLSPTTFTLNAAPIGTQAGDPCGTFTYNDRGAKDVAGATKPASECW
jgi:type IV pilus assembly protein PilE